MTEALRIVLKCIAGTLVAMPFLLAILFSFTSPSLAIVSINGLFSFTAIFVLPVGLGFLIWRLA